VRQDRLKFVAENLGGRLNPNLVREIDRDLRSQLKRLTKLPKNWLRIGTLSVGGAAVGFYSGGLAAPAVGTSVGKAMGLYGIVATRAGLALLGGGPLGQGLGMAGGIAVISTAGAVGAGGALAGGHRVRAVRAQTEAEIASDCAKLLVSLKHVVLQTQRDRAKADLIAKKLADRCKEFEDKLERVGGLKKTDPHADELTKMVTVLRRACHESESIIEDYKSSH
jgi:hypothetical protein